MSKFKDTQNIGKVINDLTGQKPEILSEKEAFNYIMPTMQRLYNMIRPSQISVDNSNIVFFNSTEDNSDNYFTGQLIDYYNSASATFSNFINLRRNMLIGEGLKPIVASGDTLYQPTIEFLNRENEFGESLANEIWGNMCMDYSLFESFFLENIFGKDGKVASVIHHSPDSIRAVANSNANLSYTEIYQISRNWGRSNQTGKYVKEAKTGVPIYAWNPQNWASSGGRQLLGSKRYNGKNQVYTIPSYASILNYIQLDAELSEYALSTVTKGFVPQVIVTLNGNPDAKSKQEFINRFRQRYSGPNSERILFIWTTSEQEKPTITPFQNSDITDLLKALDAMCAQKISSGMGGNLELAGVQTANNSLQSDLNKLAVSYNYYYKTIILPLQMEMLKTLNKIFRLNGLSDVTVNTPALTLEVPQTKDAVVQPNNVKDLMK